MSSSPARPSQSPDTATSVRVRDGQVSTTDGPFVETKEYLAGYYSSMSRTSTGPSRWLPRSPTPAAAPSRSARSWIFRAKSPVPHLPTCPRREPFDDLFRRETGQVLATLIRVLGDFDLAEDALQEAMIAALQSWPASGVPDRPGAWLLTTARRKAIDRLRREAQRDQKHRAAQVLLDAATGRVPRRWT